jgi:hypothetical protein
MDVNNAHIISDLQKIALRQNAVYIPNADASFSKLTGETLRLIDTLRKHGFVVTEPLLHAINHTTSAFKEGIKSYFEEVLGTKLNWTPLVKNWEIPTGESVYDHWITAWFNQEIGELPNEETSKYYHDKVYDNEKYTAVKLDCGHIIPDGTFPMNRYNGCPFCGTPFVFGKLKLENQGSKLKVIDLWTEKEMKALLESLLVSKVPLDATQTDSLKLLLKYYKPENEVVIGVKETLILVVDELISQGKEQDAGGYFRSPTDILRYLWYKKTGFLQIIKPKVVAKNIEQNHKHIQRQSDLSVFAKIVGKERLKLKYSRKEAKMAAVWLNQLPLSVEKIAEQMHPNRQMWVRFIRALRLAEYSRNKGFDKLKAVLDVFYNQTYEVWQGKVDYFRSKTDAERTFALLQQKPSLFARSLFSNMLWFGAEETLQAFEKVSSAVPMKFLLALNSFVEIYFDREAQRSVKTAMGTRKSIPANKFLSLYSDEELVDFQSCIKNFTLKEIERRFSQSKAGFKNIYIDPKLYEIPLPIGDRSQNLQDFNPTLMGETFPLEGNKIRLFMQWGKGLPAQHMDMDLSCSIIYEDRQDVCNYSNLSLLGCKHSGDIRSIPNKIGTAEYIDVDISALQKAGGKYVVFTCSAYSLGSITSNLVVGWMDSKHKMKVSERSGVAYDPSCVIHQIRISQPLQKGLVFGVLDVSAQKIIWLEQPFVGQTIWSLCFEDVETLLKKLSAKISVGEILKIKAKAQSLEVVETIENADFVYNVEWARKPENINSLLLN